MNKSKKTIWILSDERAGSSSQSLGIAEKIGYPFEVKQIKYNTLIKLPNLLRRATLIGVDKKNSDNLNAPYPDVVISSGRRLATICAYIKKQSPKTFAVHITNPNLPFSMFDLVVLPKHDGITQDIDNILTTIGAVNKINKQKMADDGKKWKKELSKMPSPRISVLLGGDTKSTKFSPEKFADFAKTLSDIAKKECGSLLITTSRRTSSKCVEAFKKNLNCKNYFYDWSKDNSLPKNKKNPLGNPYFAYLELGEYLVVTGDSMSMCSEACSTGKPVYIYASKEEIPAKHFKFCNNIVKNGYAKWFRSKLKNLVNYKYTPLNESQRVADFINKKIK